MGLVEKHTYRANKATIFSSNDFKFEKWLINYDLLGMRSELSDMIVRGNHPRTIPSRFWLKWYSGFRRIFSNDFLFGENQPNFHIFVQKKQQNTKC
jgi:hypothetical protein